MAEQTKMKKAKRRQFHFEIGEKVAAFRDGSIQGGEVIRVLRQFLLIKFPGSGNVLHCIDKMNVFRGEKHRGKKKSKKHNSNTALVTVPSTKKTPVYRPTYIAAPVKNQTAFIAVPAIPAALYLPEYE